VALCDDETMCCLALPSGLVLISTGVLRGLEDEAELAFVVAHEVAHIAAGDAARALVRFGLQNAASRPQDLGRAAWVRAAGDVVSLGHGMGRERSADLRAVEAMMRLGYDPRSALRYLDRLELKAAVGAPEMAPLLSAHPPPHDRVRRLEPSLRGRVGAGRRERVNRELFRRVAGHVRLHADLRPTAGIVDATPDPAGSGAEGRGRSGVAWGVAGLLLLAALFLVVGMLLSR
jgi:predicted Zn-dependent protease